MLKKSNIWLKILNVMAWVIFIGLCIKAGAILFNYLYCVFYKKIAAKNLYEGLDLSLVLEKDSVSFSIIMLSIFTIFVLQALLFYTILLIFQKLNYVKPFDESIGKLISKISVFSLIIGLTIIFSSAYLNTLNLEMIVFSNVKELIGNGDVFIVFAGILYFISLIFKKGIELQQETEFTI